MSYCDLQIDEVEDDLETERDTDGGDTHRERHERRQAELDLGIASERRRTAYGD